MDIKRMIADDLAALTRAMSLEEEIERTLPQGVLRWTKNDPEEHWARVHVRLGEWIDLPKADYDAQKIEPSFWELPGHESWQEGVVY